MASTTYRKQLSLLKPGSLHSVAVSVNAKREVKVHTDMSSSLTITPPGSPPGALGEEPTTTVTMTVTTSQHQIQDQKLREANLPTPNASPIHETDAYSKIQKNYYHPTLATIKANTVLQTQKSEKAYAYHKVSQPSMDCVAPVSYPSPMAVLRAAVTPRKALGRPLSLVDESIVELCRKIDQPTFRSIPTSPPPIPTRMALDRIPIEVPEGLQAYEKKNSSVFDTCPSCLLPPGPVFDDECEDSCHRPVTPPNLTFTDYRSATEDVCKYDMPTLVRARELADKVMWSKRAEFSKNIYLQSMLMDTTSGVLDTDVESDSSDSSDYDALPTQSPALEARLRRRMKKAKRRKKHDSECSDSGRGTDNSEGDSISGTLMPRTDVSANSTGDDLRVPDLKMHTYIPTDHNSYCAPSKPSSAKLGITVGPSIEHGMDGIVVVKEPNGRLNTTVPGSLPTDSTTPRKILSQVGNGQRKRTLSPDSVSISQCYKRNKRSFHREDSDGDSPSRAVLAEKKEKHKQSERVRRNKSSLLIKSLQKYIADTCGKNYFKCKNRSENPSKQATVETTVHRFLELDAVNNQVLMNVNATFTHAVDMLKGLQKRAHNSGRFRTLAQAFKVEAEGLRGQMGEHTQNAQVYGK